MNPKWYHNEIDKVRRYPASFAAEIINFIVLLIILIGAVFHGF